MKTAMVILYVLVAGLLVLAFLQWRTIQKLTPVVPPVVQNTAGDGSARFGDMVNAVKKELERKEIIVKF